MLSNGVGPYASWQVAPSGSAQFIRVTVTPGLDLEQDIFMSGSDRAVPQWAASETFAVPAQVPVAGDWVGSLDTYGESAYFWLSAQTNRTLSVDVTALEDSDTASETKIQPVIGIWALSDPQGTPPPSFTSSPFNTSKFGLTRLDTQIFNSGTFRIGISDLRGDGRPDYHYHAHILYGDTAVPARFGVNGGPLTLKGIGFSPSLTVAVGSAAPVAPIAAGADEILVVAPPHADGPQTITIFDPVSGAFSTMTDAITYGAAATDTLALLQGTNPPTPIGTQATNPVIVRVLSGDGKTPVNGATISWSTTNGATLSACGGISSCVVATDATGFASSWVTPGATGAASITASLAPGVYGSSPSVTGTLQGTSSAKDIGVLSPFISVASGATVSTSLTARVVSNGIPQAAVSVDFIIDQGLGTLSAPSAKTNSAGYASVTLSVSNIAAHLQLSACVAPSDNPCQNINVTPVPIASLNLQPVAGTSQVVTIGQPFQPLAVRITDSASPPNSVLGANVTFLSTVMRPDPNSWSVITGQLTSSDPGEPAILSVSQTTLSSDANGIASVIPSVGSFTGPLQVSVVVSAGADSVLQYAFEALPGIIATDTSGTRTPPLHEPRSRHFPLLDQEPNEFRWRRGGLSER